MVQTICDDFYPALYIFLMDGYGLIRLHTTEWLYPCSYCANGIVSQLLVCRHMTLSVPIRISIAVIVRRPDEQVLITIPPDRCNQVRLIVAATCILTHFHLIHFMSFRFY